MKVAGIYLAAGNSRRMGTHKLALPVGMMSLGSLALETALRSSLNLIYVIVQETDDMIWLPSNMKADERCKILQCTTAAEGQSESLRCGIRQAKEDGFDAVMVMLADQPFITTLMINEMIACIRDKPSRKFIATSFDGIISPPVLFSSAMYPALFNLTGDAGAKTLLHDALLNEGKLLPCNDKRLVFDIDTKEDYDKLFSYLEQ